MSKDKLKVKIKSETLGEKLKFYRKCKGLTQEQLAEQIDIDTKYLARLEKDMHNPTFNVMKKLAQALDFDLSKIDETSAKNNTAPSKTYIKAIQVLNSAKTEDDLKLYFEALRHTQKCLNKNCSAED